MFHVPDWDADGLPYSGSQTQQGRAAGKLKVKKSNKRSKERDSSGANGDLVNTPSFMPAATFAFDDSDDESRGLSKKAKKHLKEKRRKQRAKSLREVDDDESALTEAAPAHLGLGASEDGSVKQKKKRKRKRVEEPVDYLNTDLMKVFQEAGLLQKTSGSQGGKENANSHPQKSKKRKLDLSPPRSQANGNNVDLPTSSKKKRKRKRDNSASADQKKARMSPTRDASGKTLNLPASSLAEGSTVVDGESVEKKKRKRNRKKSLTSTESSAASPGVGQPNTLHTQKSKVSVPGMNEKINDKSDNADEAAENQPADGKPVRKRKRKNSRKNKYKHLAESNGTEASGVKQTVEEVSSHKKSKVASPIPCAEKKACKKDSLKDVVETTPPKKKKKQKKTKELKSSKNVQEDLSPHLEPSPSKRKKQTAGKTPETESLAGAQPKSVKKLPATPKCHLPFDKQRLSAILESSSVRPVSERVKESVRKEAAKPASLKERLEAELSAAHFRYLNEKLYTCRSSEAQKLFKENQDAFQVYHQGFQNQVARWPVNPLDVIIKEIKSRPANMKIADFGCGDAKLAQSVPNKVHSFDLIALNEHVTVCDMAKVPLPDESVHVAVFCLSLMGTNLVDYLLEANRILKQGGTLKIAEVTSRLNKLTNFIVDVEKLGFKFENKDVSNNMFILMNFKKKKTVTKGKGLPEITLPPCLYKKR